MHPSKSWPLMGICCVIACSSFSDDGKSPRQISGSGATGGSVGSAGAAGSAGNAGAGTGGLSVGGTAGAGGGYIPLRDGGSASVCDQIYKNYKAALLDA